MSTPPPLTPTQSRTLGALLGVHAGDSLGATCEFKPHSEIKRLYPHGLTDIIGGGSFHWPAGHATDDTDMTRAVLLAYQQVYSQQHTNAAETSLDASKNNVIYLSAQNFVAWFTGTPWPGRKPGSRPADIGASTRQGIMAFRRSRDVNKAGSGENRLGNGSLMRCIPTALFQRDLAKMEMESMAISKITHDDYKCQVACAAYNAIVGALVTGATVEYAVDAGEAVAKRLDGGRETGMTYMAIREGRELGLRDLAESGPGKREGGRIKVYGGFVMQTLSLAVAALVDGRPFKDVVVDVVRVGMDTDTNGAVAGGLVGARDGIEMIPVEWRDKLQFRDEFVKVGLDILSMMD